MDASILVRARLFAIATLTTGVLFATAGPSAAASCPPSIVDLGDPYGGGLSFADGINRHGTVVGTGLLPSGAGRATMWRHGKAINLGVVGKYDESFAHGVNDDGVVVGELNFRQRKAAPFIYVNGRMRSLPGLGGDFGYASAVNARGIVVGTASDSDGFPHAVVWTDNGRHVHDLGIAPGDVASFGSGISDSNVVAGDTDGADNSERPALFDHGVVVLSPAVGEFGAAEDINTSGRVVGISFMPSGEEHATVWSSFNARGTDLGTLPGGAFAALIDVDNDGRAAGASNAGNHPDVVHAVVWPGSGPLLALRPLSGHYVRDFAVARDLGVHGEAVGGSQNIDGDVRATIWKCAFNQAFRPPRPGTGTATSSSTAHHAATHSALAQAYAAWLRPEVAR
jgi:probable HAF family extracellular repeat protein